MFQLLFDALEDGCSPGSFIHIAQARSLIPAQLRCRNYTSGKAAQNKYLPQAIRCMYRELDRTLPLDELVGVRQGVLSSFLTICSTRAFTQLRKHPAPGLFFQRSDRVHQVIHCFLLRPVFDVVAL